MQIDFKHQSNKCTFGLFLSSVLITIYLDHALKGVQPTLPRPISSFEVEIPNEVAYADDVDFIGQNLTMQILRRSKKF